MKRFSTPKHKEITGSLHKHSLVDTLSSLIVDILGVFSDFSRHIVAFNVFSEILDAILRKFLPFCIILSRFVPLKVLEEESKYIDSRIVVLPALLGPTIKFRDLDGSSVINSKPLRFWKLSLLMYKSNPHRHDDVLARFVPIGSN